MLKIIICLVLASLSSFFKVNAQDTLLYLSLDGLNQKKFVEPYTGNQFEISSLKDSLENVPGISGNGLRTDGYSTFISGKVSKGLPMPVTVNGWFALETYPTDTAGLFSLSGSRKDLWITACVNQFGKIIVGIKTPDRIVYVDGIESINKFEWVLMSLVLNTTGVRLFVNGRLSNTSDMDMSKFSGLDSMIIGRDTRDKKLHIFPTTAINGIVDEITIVRKALTDNEIADLSKQQEKIKPNLDIPPSRFANDFSRPRYHLLPAANWTNESHGLIYYGNRYHIFNQKNGSNVFLGQINWGHFSSPDLINWTEHVPAITPMPGYDELGIWSGHCTIDKEGKPVIVYTGGKKGKLGLCLAHPLDNNLIIWKKYSGNPIVDGPPDDFTRTDLRDPYIWKEKELWYMVVGFGLNENNIEKGTLLLYRSTDLKNWKFLHTFFTGDPVNDHSGIFWEMPVVWKMNGKYIVLVNKVPVKGVPAVALYWTGEFKNERFIPDSKIPKRLEVINRLLSPSVALDANGRTTAIAIIPDETTAEAQLQQGWNHVFSIPRVWNLKNGEIYQSPHPSLERLRQKRFVVNNRIITKNNGLLLTKGRQVEIKIVIDPLDAKSFCFYVGRNKKTREETKIKFDVSGGQIIVDQTLSTKRKFIPLDSRNGKVNLSQKNPIEIRLFIDGSVIEGFVNNKDAFTTRIFPLSSESNQVELSAGKGNINVIRADIWNLKESPVKSDF